MIEKTISRTRAIGAATVTASTHGGLWVKEAEPHST